MLPPRHTPHSARSPGTPCLTTCSTARMTAATRSMLVIVKGWTARRIRRSFSLKPTNDSAGSREGRTRSYPRRRRQARRRLLISGHLLRAALEMPAGALPADSGGRARPRSICEPRLELPRRHGPPRDGLPRAGAVEGQHLDPRALHRAVEARKVAGVEPRRRDHVIEAQAWEIAHGPAVLEDGHHDVIVAAGRQVGARAVEPAPAGVPLDGFRPRERGLSAEGHPGAERGKCGVLVPRRAGGPEHGGDQLGIARVAHREEGDELALPREGGRLERRYRLPARGAEPCVALEEAHGLGDVAGGQDVVVIDEDDDGPLRGADPGQPGRREPEPRLAEHPDVAGGVVAVVLLRGERRRGVVDEEGLPEAGRERLIPQPAERPPEAPEVGVVGGDDDGDGEGGGRGHGSD